MDVSLSGVTLEGNVAAGSGGGMALSWGLGSARVAMEACAMAGNAADQQNAHKVGGALYATGNVTVVLSACNVTGNTGLVRPPPPASPQRSPPLPPHCAPRCATATRAAPPHALSMAALARPLRRRATMRHALPTVWPLHHLLAQCAHPQRPARL